MTSHQKLLKVYYLINIGREYLNSGNLEYCLPVYHEAYGLMGEVVEDAALVRDEILNLMNKIQEEIQKKKAN